MTRIVCVGNSVIDRIYRIDAFPPKPMKVRALEYMESGGGTAANAAATIARLGTEVELWSRTGGDDVGVQIRRGLSAVGVDVRYVQAFDDCRSSTSAVIVDGHGERFIVGARDVQLPSDTTWLPLERLGDASCVLADLRWLEAARVVFERARKLGVPTILDPDLGTRDVLEELLPLADYAIFPEPTLGDFSRSEGVEAKLFDARAYGPQHVGVTCGERGYHWLDAQGYVSMPAFRVDVVDTTGAGDAFHGAFAVGVVEHRVTADNVRFASAVAALKCQRLGARAGLPTRAEVEAFLVANPVLH